MTSEAPVLTPEEQAALDEQEAQKADLEAAEAEQEASIAKMESLEKLTGVHRFRGPGFILVHNEKRGDTKAFSGDLIFSIKYPEPEPVPVPEGELEDKVVDKAVALITRAGLPALDKPEEFVLPEEAFLLLSGLEPVDLPDEVEYRAARIRAARLAEPPPTPAPEA